MQHVDYVWDEGIAEQERWSSSAEAFAQLAPQISFFQEMSRLTVEMARLRNDMSVIDLGCGSSDLVLRHMHNTAPILRAVYRVDVCDAMLVTSARSANGENIKHVHGPAEYLHTIIPEQVDRVICNCAFGLFNHLKALQAIKKVLLPTGIFICNFAEWDFDFGGEKSSDPKYEAIDKQLERFGLPPKPNRGSPHKLSLEGMRRLLGMTELKLSKIAIQETAVSASDWQHFYEVPAIAKRSLSHLPLNTAMEVLRTAMDEIKDRKLPPLKWMVIALEHE